MRRSGEVRLADFQVDDLAPARLDSARLEEDIERALTSKRSHAAGDLRHPHNVAQDRRGANESPLGRSPRDFHEYESKRGAVLVLSAEELVKRVGAELVFFDAIFGHSA
jgi:hypothetical protein